MYMYITLDHYINMYACSPCLQIPILQWLNFQNTCDIETVHTKPSQAPGQAFAGHFRRKHTTR